jgi:hypothetical protein
MAAKSLLWNHFFQPALIRELYIAPCRPLEIALARTHLGDAGSPISALLD